jgi:hypothetical protein
LQGIRGALPVMAEVEAERGIIRTKLFLIIKTSIQHNFKINQLKRLQKLRRTGKEIRRSSLRYSLKATRELQKLT